MNECVQPTAALHLYSLENEKAGEAWAPVNLELFLDQESTWRLDTRRNKS